METRTVTQEVFLNATPQEVFGAFPATGKKVFWTENHIYRLRNGMIAEIWSEPSFHDLMAQIKGTKAAGQAAD